MNYKLIFLYTVHHTGTWFFIEFLKRNKDVKQFYLMKEFYAVEDWILHDKVALHNHVHLNRPELYKEWKRVPFLFTNHYYNDALAAAYPTIIPTRDPLLSLITRHKRHSDWSHRFIVEGFCELAKHVHNPNVIYMPLDLMTTTEQRTAAFERLCTHCQIAFDDYTQDYARNWVAQNSWEDKYDFKRKYAERDKAGLRQILGEDYNALVAKKAILQPFLYQLGYRDLIWWEDED